MKNPNDQLGSKHDVFVVPQVKGKPVKHEFSIGRGPAKQLPLCGKCRQPKDYLRINASYGMLVRTDRPIAFPPTMVHVENDSDVCPPKRRAAAPEKIRPITGADIGNLIIDRPE